MSALPAPVQRALPALVALVLAGSFVARGEHSLRGKSPVWDEVMHLDYGLGFLQHGPSVPPRDHPYPITALLAAPLALAQPAPEQVLARVPLPGSERTAEIRVAEDPRNLFPPRRMNLALAALGLLALGALVARRLGAWTGASLVALGALDPGWLAQARFLTTDIAHGLAFGLGALALTGPTRRHRVIWGGLATALGLSAKLSGGLLVIAAVLVRGLAEARQPGAGRAAKAVRGALVEGAAVGLVGLAAWLALFHLHALAGAAPWDAGLAHVREALHQFVTVRSEAHGTFLLGRWHPDGTAAYFPALLAAKTPLLLLALVAAAVALPASRQRLRALGPLWLVPALYLVVAVASGVTLGHRHLLPLLPFLWLAAALGLHALAARLPAPRLLLPALLLALAAEGAATHPHYLPYANAAFGGLEGARHVAVDSATDWGQDLPALAAWQRVHATGQPLHLAYFGTADPARYGLSTVWRPCGRLGRPRPRGAPAAACGAPAPLLAVSATCLEGATGGVDRDPCWSRLRDRAPDALIGGSILVFRDVAAAPARP